MDRSFAIDFEWLQRYSADVIDRYTLADLRISVGNKIATELQDISVKTVRPTMRGSAYDMAVWLLQNWWRLIYEPERDTLDWRMSHCLGAIGKGFLWPDIRFISDGAEMTICSRASDPSSTHPVRYLNNIYETTSLDGFGSTVLGFADAVIERVRETGTENSLLHNLREDIRAEESDPEYRHWRQIEALLGYDPDEASDEAINEVISESLKYGSDSINEVIAFSGKDAGSIFEWMTAARSAGSPLTVPDTENLRRKTASINPSLLPWERAEEAARIARAQWSLSEKPISNEQLKDLFSLKNSLLSDYNAKGQLSVAFRNGDIEHLEATLTSPHEASRRFSLLRVVADHLYSPGTDHILPVTKAKTARQKFQRTFAQEFLCPSRELSAFMGKDYSDDRLEEAASYFNVSSLLVKSTLVNKGLLNRDEIIDP